MAEEMMTGRLMDQVSEELLKPFREPIESVYIDADFLYDYRLGELLLKTKGPEQYAYVMHYLKDYENGCSRKITKYFTALPVEEEDLDKMEKDPNMWELIHLAAPPTKFLGELANFITRVNTFNTTKEIAKPLKVVINQKREGMPAKVWKDLRDYLLENCGQLDLQLTFYKSWGEIPEHEFLSWKMILVHDLVDFLKVGSTSQKALKENKCLDKIVLSPFQTEEDFEDKEQEKKALENFSAIMTLLVSEFSFVKRSILIRSE